MKKLFLLRHGKSDWKASFQTDHERPINARGRKSSLAMGSYLSARSLCPDLILCSTATRTRETLGCIVESAGWQDVPVTFEDSLYLADPSTARRLINTRADGLDVLFVVGHQPTMSGLIHELTGAHVDVPTATLIELDTPSGAADAGMATLSALVNPKSLD